MPGISSIKVFADGAQRDAMVKRAQQGFVKGFTTNPSLLAKAGVRDYEAFAKDVLKAIPNLPISFEVIADTHDEMIAQAKRIATWGPNVNIKIPICNTKGEPTLKLIRELCDMGHALNITALFAESQLLQLHETLKPTDKTFLSIFAGRLADNGHDPIPLVKLAVEKFRDFKGTEILWASTREVWNFYEAARLGVHIITAPDDLIEKVQKKTLTPEEATLDTVRVFFKDSTGAGLRV